MHFDNRRDDLSHYSIYLGQVLINLCAVKAQTSLRIRTVSPEPLLPFTHRRHMYEHTEDT